MAVAGALLFGYVHVDDGELKLRVTIDLDDIAEDIRTGPDDTVALDVRIGDRLIFDSDRPRTTASRSLQPVPADLVVLDSGHAYWLEDSTLMAAPTLASGTISWSEATEIDHDRSDPEARPGHGRIEHVLRTAAERTAE